MSQVVTPYGTIDAKLKRRLSRIKLLACDVDGVFSDGLIYMGNQGEELKSFHTKDGYGVKSLMAEGVQVAIITGRSSEIVTDRFSALGVKHIIQGESDKQTALMNLQQKLGIDRSQTCSIGDDLPDTGMFKESELAVAPLDAHPTVIGWADYTTVTKGGAGCVRELCDLILFSLDKLEGTDSHKIRAASV